MLLDGFDCSLRLLGAMRNALRCDVVDDELMAAENKISTGCSPLQLFRVHDESSDDAALVAQGSALERTESC